jgi:hypothetical protein
MKRAPRVVSALPYNRLAASGVIFLRGGRCATWESGRTPLKKT